MSLDDDTRNTLVRAHSMAQQRRFLNTDPQTYYCSDARAQWAVAESAIAEEDFIRGSFSDEPPPITWAEKTLYAIAACTLIGVLVGYALRRWS